MSVVDRADGISHEFFKAFKEKLATKRHSDFPLEALSDFAWLMRVALDNKGPDGDVDMEEEDVKGNWKKATKVDQMNLIRKAVTRYAVSV